MINSNMLSGGNGKDVQSNAVCVHDTCVKLKTVGINMGIIALAMERYHKLLYMLPGKAIYTLAQCLWIMHAHISAAAEPCTVSCFNNCMSKVTFDTHSVLLDRYMEVCVCLIWVYLYDIKSYFTVLF